MSSVTGHTATSSQENSMRIEIREGKDSPTGSNFHVYVEGRYHCSCVSRSEAEEVVRQRFPT
jgi:hypothetical protein